MGFEPKMFPEENKFPEVKFTVCTNQLSCYFQFFTHLSLHNNLIAFNNHKILVRNYFIIYQLCSYFPFTTSVHSIYSVETNSFKVCLFNNYDYVCKESES